LLILLNNTFKSVYAEIVRPNAFKETYLALTPRETEILKWCADGKTSVEAPYETIYDTQYSTTGDHGGSQVRAYVWQIGYGNVNNATFNGISKAPTLTSYRCGSDLHECSSGETVTGFLYQFDFFGSQSGQLTVSSTYFL
jgi:hypothetical protein